MKKLLTILLMVLTLPLYSQDYTYLDEVETKLIVNENILKIDFDRVMVVNIVLTNVEGTIVDKFTNYTTNKNLSLVMNDYGPGIFYLIIQWNSKIAVKRIKVKRDITDSYTEQYKLIIK